MRRIRGRSGSGKGVLPRSPADLDANHGAVRVDGEVAVRPAQLLKD